jgi:hypothetical protein
MTRPPDVDPPSSMAGCVTTVAGSRDNGDKATFGGNAKGTARPARRSSGSRGHRRDERPLIDVRAVTCTRDGRGQHLRHGDGRRRGTVLYRSTSRIWASPGRPTRTGSALGNGYDLRRPGLSAEAMSRSTSRRSAPNSRAGSTGPPRSFTVRTPSRAERLRCSRVMSSNRSSEAVELAERAPARIPTRASETRPSSSGWPTSTSTRHIAWREPSCEIRPRHRMRP